LENYLKINYNNNNVKLDLKIIYNYFGELKASDSSSKVSQPLLLAFSESPSKSLSAHRSSES